LDESRFICHMFLSVLKSMLLWMSLLRRCKRELEH
jgi:hypothetical protein